MKRQTLEKKIQRDIEIALGAEPGLLLLRNSVGRAKHVSDDGKVWHVPYGLQNGSPDLVGLLETEGGLAAWFCLEVKAPEGVVEPAQEECHALWRKFGALVFVVRSVDDARKALKYARLMVAR